MIFAGDLLKKINGNFRPEEELSLEVTDEGRRPLYFINISSRKCSKAIALKPVRKQQWQGICLCICMPRFHFKLVDTNIVSSHGVHELADETAAQIEAIKLARSLRQTRPDLVGRKCSVAVADEHGVNVCTIPIDDI